MTHDHSRHGHLVDDPTRVLTREIDRVAHAVDASHYRLVPEAVVIARDHREVGELLRRASRAGSPITFRAGGTSLAGQSVGPGVVVDVRRGFRDVTVLDGGRRVRVQPGATVRAVNAHLRPHGHRLGPDPASEAACTIGGVVANNSSGMECGTTENTYRTLESMVFVLPSGTTIDTADPTAGARLRHVEPELAAGLARLCSRVRGNPDSVARIEKHFALKNTMGYGLNAFLDFDNPLDILTRLVIGSEGTLAFVAEATFRTVPLATATLSSLALFETLEQATEVLPDLVSTGPATVELMDATSLRVGQHLPGTPASLRHIDVVEHAALLVEYKGSSSDSLADVAARGASLLSTPTGGPAAFTASPVERQAMWAFRKGLYASVAGNRPAGTMALLEDVAVPVPALADTCRQLQGLVRSHGYDDSVIFGHAKDGNLHFMLTDRFHEPTALRRLDAFTHDMADLVLGAGGNLKAEHGTGRAMAPFVERQYGPELYEVMRELKALCDPHGILNPGVVISDDATVHVRDFKANPPVEEEVDRCVECGYCEPVCPSQDLTLTPRQRITVRRARAAAEQAGDAQLARRLAQQETYDSVQTCAVDSMCRTACPLGIDTGALVKRLRAEGAGPVATAGWGAAAAAWGPVTRGASVALSVAAAAPAVVTGMTDLGRMLLGEDLVPRYGADLPGGGRGRARLAGLVGGGEGPPRAVWVPACVNSMFGGSDGPGVTDAMVMLLERAGVRVLVPDAIESLCCGTPWSSKGMRAGHARVVARVRRELAALGVGHDVPVISDATSCTQGFAGVLAADGWTVEDATTFVAREALPHLAVRRRLASVVLHPTCSSVQLGIDGDIATIAAAFAEDVVTPLDWRCCGFAGDRGLLHPELTASATAREAHEVAARHVGAYAAANRTCEIGMARATGRPYRHVLELLAEATTTGW